MSLWIATRDLNIEEVLTFSSPGKMLACFLSRYLTPEHPPGPVASEDFLEM